MECNLHWGWIIAVTGMIIPSMYAAAQRCFSAFYGPLINEFNANYMEVSWLNGLFLAGYGIGSLVVPILYKRFSYRLGVMVAGLISSVSVFIASFQTTLLGSIWLTGFTPGLCTAVTTVGIYGSVQKYFFKRRNTAMQFLCAGASVGAFIYCPVYQLLIDTYTWRGALQVIAGFYLQIVVVGSLLRPLECSKTPNITIIDVEAKYSSSENIRSSKCEIAELSDFGVSDRTGIIQTIKKLAYESGISVLVKTKFHLFCWSWIFFAAAYYSSLTYLIPFGKNNHEISDVEATMLVSAVSCGELASRLILASSFDKFGMPQRMLIVSGIHLLLSGIYATVPFLPGYVSLLAICAIIGASGGGMDAIYAVFTGEIFGSHLFDAVYSYSSVLSFLAGSATTVLFGAAIDAFSDISVVFYFGSGCLAISSFLMFAEARLCNIATDVDET